MTNASEKIENLECSSSNEIKHEGSRSGFLLQIGETVQTAIVSVLDGSSTIFRSIIGTFKDSTVFVVRSTKEVSDEVGNALSSSIKNTIEVAKNVSTEGTKVTFGFVNNVGENLKSSTLNTIEGSHEITTKAANTFGKTLVDLSQCTYDTGSKIGTVAKSAALNTIRGVAEVGEELFGKIKSGALGVIPLDKFRFTKKKPTEQPVIETPIDKVENN